MIESREYTEYVKIDAFNGETYALASQDNERNGVWYFGWLLNSPQPADAFQDQFGISRSDKVNIEAFDDGNNVDYLVTKNGDRIVTKGGNYIVVNNPDTPSLKPLSTRDVIGDTATVEVVITTNYEDGTSTESTFKRQMNIQSYSKEPSKLTLTAVDLDYERLNNLFPQALYTVDDWPNLFQDHVEWPVPYVTGTGLKMPCAYIDDNGGLGPWRYGVCQDPDNTVSVLTVYREGRIVDSSEYTVVRDTSPSGYDLTVLEFSKEQVDFDNSIYTIEADVKRDVSQNVVDEIQRLLEFVGYTADSTTFTDASTYYDNNIQTQDDVPLVEQKKVRALLDDLLVVARSHLYRKADGSIAIYQDQPRSSVATFDEDAGDSVELESTSLPELLETVELKYRPAIREPRGELQHTISRSPGGPSGVKRYKNPFVRDHTAADKLVDYLGKKHEYNEQASLIDLEDTVSLGDVITVKSDLFYTGEKDWVVTGVKMIDQGQSLTLREYDSSVYTYESGTLPSDATQGYKPDYSETPPDAPTNLTIDDNGTYTTEDGTNLSYLGVSADIPSQNAEFIEFLVVNNTTNEQFVQKGEVQSGATWYHRFKGLTPGESHSVSAWAVNNFGVKGQVAT